MNNFLLIIMLLFFLMVGIDFMLLSIYQGFARKKESDFSKTFDRFCDKYPLKTLDISFRKAEKNIYSHIRKDTFGKYILCAPQQQNEIDNVLSAVIYLHESAHIIDNEKHINSYNSFPQTVRFMYFVIVNMLIIPSLFIIVILNLFAIYQPHKVLLITYFVSLLFIFINVVIGSIKEFRVIHMLNIFFDKKKCDQNYRKVNWISLYKQCTTIAIYLLLLVIPVCCFL